MGQGLVVLALPLLTRLYTPEDFGVLAVYVSILSILVVVASLRYELAIPLPESNEDAANLIALSLWIVLAMSLTVGLIIWLLFDQIVVWTKIPALRHYLWLLPLSLLGAGTYKVLNYFAVRQRAFGPIAYTKISQSLGQVLTQLGFGFLNLGSLGLLVGDVVGRIGGSGTLTWLALKWIPDWRKVISRKGIFRVAYCYRRFPMLSSCSAILNSAGLQLPALLLAAFYGPQVAGWFALGQRVIGLPVSLVEQAVAQVYLGEASRLRREDPLALHSLFLQVVKKLLMVSVLPIALLGFAGPWLFALVFGSEWQVAGTYTQILSLMFLFDFVVFPISQTLNLLEKQDVQLGWDIARLVVVNGGLFLAGLYGLSHQLAVGIYGVSMAFMYTILGLLSLKAIQS